MRPPWDDYFMSMASLVSERATCQRLRVGAVLVRDRRILATGYNGAPKGLTHCLQLGCLRDELKVPEGERHELCRGVHAEQNAIIQCAVFGVSTRGATLYTTHFPCTICAKIIINAEVGEVVYGQDYPDDQSKKLLAEAGIKLRKWKPRAELGPPEKGV